MKTYTCDELASALGVVRGTIFRYVRKGLLPKPVARNKYTEAHLERGRAIREILDAHLSYEDALKDLVRRDEQAAAAKEEQARESKALDRPFSTSLGFEHWQRVKLLPGLELSIAADASPLVRRTAEEVVRYFGVAPKS